MPWSLNIISSRKVANSFKYLSIFKLALFTTCLFINSSKASDLNFSISKTPSTSYSEIGEKEDKDKGDKDKGDKDKGNKDKGDKDKGDKKSDDSPRTPSSAPESNLLTAPTEIEAGGNGNLVLRLTNPSIDTLNLDITSNLPDGWILLNSRKSVKLLPKQKKTIVFVVQPTGNAHVGMQSLRFTFWDRNKEVSFSQTVQIQIKEKHSLTINQVTRQKYIGAGDEPIQVIYEIQNSGNVSEAFELLVTKDQPLSITLMPKEVYKHVVSTSISKASKLRNYYVNCIIQPEYQLNKITKSTGLIVLRHRIKKPKQTTGYPLRYSFRGNNNIGASSTSSNATTQSLTARIFDIANKNSLDFNLVNRQLDNLSVPTLQQTIINGNFIHQHSSSTSKLSFGTVPMGSSFYNRIPNNYYSTGYQRKFDSGIQLSALHRLRNMNNLTDTISNISQFKTVLGGVNKLEFNQTLLKNDNNRHSLLTENSLYLNKRSFKLATTLISYSRSLNQTLTVESLAVNNHFEYQKKDKSVFLNTFLSGRDFTTNSSSLLRLNGNAAYSSGIFRFSLRHYLANSSFRSTGLINLNQSSSLNANVQLDKSLTTNLGISRSQTKISSGSKTNLATALSGNVGFNFRNTLGSIASRFNIQQQSVILNSNASEPTIRNDFNFSYSSPSGTSTQLKLQYKNVFGRGSSSQQRITTAINTKLSKKLKGSLKSTLLINANTLSNYTYQNGLNLNYRNRNYSVGVGGNAFLSPTRTNYGATINLLINFKIKRRDATNYKNLSGIIIDENAQPVKGVLLRIGNNLIVTNDQGEFDLDNVTKNQIVIDLDKSTIPFGMISSEGFSITANTLKKRNNITIKLQNSASINGATEIVTTGLLKSTVPDYNAISIRIVSVESGDELYTSFKADGSYDFRALKAGNYRLYFIQTPTSKLKWSINPSEYEFELKSNQTKAINIQLVENTRTMKMQQYSK